MTFKNIYFRILALVLFLIAVFGIIAPIFISSEVDLLVVAGVLLIGVSFYLAYLIIKPIFKFKTEEK